MALNDDSRKKLKAILGAKLIETVGSCENELPDYIISMITNNKTREYMRDSLTLFIGEHAEAFSGWLSDLKEKLQRECPAVIQPSAPVKTEAKVEVKIELKPEARRARTPERDVKNDRRRDEVVRKRSDKDDWDHRSPRTNNRERHDERRRYSPYRRDHRSLKTSRRESPVRQRRDRSRSRSRSVERSRDRSEKKDDRKYSSSALDSSKSTVRSSVSAKKSDRSDAEKNEISSKLFGTAFMQAIADASRVAKEKAKKDEEVSVDVVEKSRNDEKSTVHCDLKNGSKNGPSVTVRLNSGFKVPSSKLYDEPSPKTTLKRKIVFDLNSDETSLVKKETPTVVSTAHMVSKPSAAAPKVPKCEVFDHAENEAAIDAFLAATKLELAIALKAANGSSDIKEEFKEEPMEEIEEYEMDIQEEYPKAKTRCVFWPSCRNGDECEYAHPTVRCMKFPYCAYGQHCLYIHPPCRYGAGCLNSNCGALHAAPESIEIVCKLLNIPVPEFPSNEEAQNEGAEISVDSALPSPFANIPCRFRNMCRNPDCAYKHPVECRYGRDCQMAMCAFRHPEGKKPASAFPDAAKYKWKPSY